MRNSSLVLVLLSGIATSWAVEANRVGSGVTPNVPFALRQQLVDKAQRTSLVFEPNHGQTAKEVRWLVRTSSYQAFFTDKDIALRLFEGAGRPQSVVRISFSGDGLNATRGQDPTGGHSNYFLGNDASQWRTEIPHYKGLLAERVAPGVDLRFYGAGGSMEYDVIAHPGADVSGLRVKFAGAKQLLVNEQGDLEIHTPTGAVLLQKRPVVFQEKAGRKNYLPARYVKLDGSSVGFHVLGYDRKRALVIDPILAYSTFLGGSQVEVGNNDAVQPGMAIDSSGAAYISASSRSADYPTSVGAIMTDPNDNDMDAVVTKMNPSGSAIVYSTYLGGAFGDIGANIAVDTNGLAHVTGYTFSSNFPTVNPIHGDRVHREAFVAKLSANGTSLIYSTYLGGDNDDRASGIALDPSGNAYVAGTTFSSDFPVLNAYRSTQYVFNGGDVFVSKITPAGVLAYSTYFGGSGGNDLAYGIAVDSSGAAYVVGEASNNIPLVSPIQAVNGGAAEAFLAKFSPSGSSLLYSTYYGGNGDDRAFDVKVDGDGLVYFCGVTVSANFPVLNSPQAYGGNADAFLVKLNLNTNTLIYSAVVGGTSSDDAVSLAVDATGSVFFGGGTSSTNFPLEQSLYADQLGMDGYVAQLGPNGGALLFSSYLGGGVAGSPFFNTISDMVQKVAMGPDGSVYLMGTTASSNFPLLNPYRSINQQGELFVTKIRSDSPTQLTINPSSINLSASAFSGSIDVTASIPNASWSASSLAGWTTVNSPVGTVTGSGVISYAVADNPGPGARQTYINIADGRFLIKQAAPSYTLSTSTLSAGAGAGSLSFTVTVVPLAATWSVISNVGWISVVSPIGTVAGNAVVNLSLTANPFTFSRVGTLTFSGQTITVTQAGSGGLTPIISTFAGTGIEGSTGDGGPAVNATLARPNGIAMDPSGNLFVVDYLSYRVRRIANNGMISTAVGNGSRGSGGNGGPAVSAQINAGYHITSDSNGNLLLADTHNGHIRRISNSGIISLVAGTSPFGYGGDGGQAVNATLYFPFGATAGPDGFTYIADYGNHRIRRVAPNGIITTYAGTGTCGFGGDGGAALSAQFCYPHSIAFDSANNMYVMDTSNQRVRKITPAGIISTFAGNGTQGFAGDGGPATSAQFFNPTSVTIDGQGLMYIADGGNARIRVINTAGIIDTIAGNGLGGYSGDGMDARLTRLNNPFAVAVDPSGNLYIADSNNQRVRKITFVGGLPTPTISLNLTSVVYDGNPRAVSGTVLGSSGENLGSPSILYNGLAQAPTNAGTYTVTASFPGNANYAAASATGTFTIQKASPVIDWPTPAAIPAGTPLTAQQLNASASFGGSTVPGTFVYAPPAGTILSVGNSSLSTTFTPTDATNFQVVSASRTINVFTCSYTFTPGSATVGGSAGSSTFTVSTSNGCAVNPSSAASWISLGVVSNTVTYSYTANNSGSLRTAQILVSGVAFTLTQQTNDVLITFVTNPPGLSLILGGTTYTSPQSLSLAAGSSFPVGVGTPQSGPAGTRYAFASWSQGGAASQSLIVPTSNAAYTASFNTEYLLTTAISPPNSGSLLGGTYYLTGTTATLAAMPGSGYSFSNFGGDLSGSVSPATLVMNGPKSVTAFFFGAPALTASRSSASGPVNARVWTMLISNTASVAASNAHLSAFVLTQTAGGACSSAPVVSALPAAPNLGTIISGGSISLPVTIDFSACPAAARFSLRIDLTATGYSTTRTFVNLFR
jgi:hypothetical protein